MAGTGRKRAWERMLAGLPPWAAGGAPQPGGDLPGAAPANDPGQAALARAAGWSRDWLPCPAVIDVDASLVARELGMDPGEFRARVAAGEITRLSERGIGEDLGRFRFTFCHGQRRVCFETDTAGRVLAASGRPPPPG